MTRVKRAAASVATGAIAVLALGLPGAAFADDYTGPPPSVPASNPQVLAHTVTDPGDPKGSLPLTGADIAELSLIGAGTLTVGALAVRRARRRRTQPA
jgi:LPXTG-motif cell wall-anchored protein